MLKLCWIRLGMVPLVLGFAWMGSVGAKEIPETGKAPKELPKIPPPSPRVALVPPGFRVEALVPNLTYPTSIAFDPAGVMYIAEAGYAYGDEVAPARVQRVLPTGPMGGVSMSVVADQLSGPITALLWDRGRLYISQRGKISVLEPGGAVRDLVTGLPSLGDHHNNEIAPGPDGKLYFGQGVATNSGVVGMDNFLAGWLAKHPDVHDVPAKDISLVGDQGFETPNPIAVLTKTGEKTVKTAAFQAFGKTASDGATVHGTVKANGTILRMNPDGSGLEVYAWGLRNPFGVKWGPDGKLYVTEAGYDERGSRPIANAPDCLWVIRQGAWYGYPDYAAGIPVTDPQFKSQRGPAPKFLMKDHPPVEKPLLTLPPHTGGAKFDFSRSPLFGVGQIYVALLGDMIPVTGEPTKHPGYGVARIDPATLKVVPFFSTRQDALGPKGFEHVATAGPKRPVEVRFSPDGNALYVVDFGAMAVIPTAVGPRPRPFPGTGVVWRITRQVVVPGPTR